jgi:hypothetical protein
MCVCVCMCGLCFREKDYTTYFCAAAIFFILSTLLSIFWNFELYNRSLGLAVLATIFGPVSRNLFVEIMPSKSDSPEGWRDSDEEETEEIKNFTMIFAAMFEDLPQASVNLAFMSKGNTAPVGTSQYYVKCNFIYQLLGVTMVP